MYKITKLSGAIVGAFLLSACGVATTHLQNPSSLAPTLRTDTPFGNDISPIDYKVDPSAKKLPNGYTDDYSLIALFVPRGADPSVIQSQINELGRLNQNPDYSNNSGLQLYITNPIAAPNTDLVLTPPSGEQNDVSVTVASNVLLKSLTITPHINLLLNGGTLDADVILQPNTVMFGIGGSVKSLQNNGTLSMEFGNPKGGTYNALATYTGIEINKNSDHQTVALKGDKKAYSYGTSVDVIGDYTQGSNAILDAQFWATLNVGGVASLDGNLLVTTYEKGDDNSPLPGQLLAVVSNHPIKGNFSGITLKDRYSLTPAVTLTQVPDPVEFDYQGKHYYAIAYSTNLADYNFPLLSTDLSYQAPSEAATCEKCDADHVNKDTDATQVKTALASLTTAPEDTKGIYLNYGVKVPSDAVTYFTGTIEGADAELSFAPEGKGTADTEDNRKAFTWAGVAFTGDVTAKSFALGGHGFLWINGNHFDTDLTINGQNAYFLATGTVKSINNNGGNVIVFQKLLPEMNDTVAFTTVPYSHTVNTLPEHLVTRGFKDAPLVKVFPVGVEVTGDYTQTGGLLDLSNSSVLAVGGNVSIKGDAKIHSAFSGSAGAAYDGLLIVSKGMMDIADSVVVNPKYGDDKSSYKIVDLTGQDGKTMYKALLVHINSYNDESSRALGQTRPLGSVAHSVNASNRNEILKAAPQLAHVQVYDAKTGQARDTTVVIPTRLSNVQARVAGSAEMPAWLTGNAFSQAMLVHETNAQYLSNSDLFTLQNHVERQHGVLLGADVNVLWGQGQRVSDIERLTALVPGTHTQMLFAIEHVGTRFDANWTPDVIKKDDILLSKSHSLGLSFGLRQKLSHGSGLAIDYQLAYQLTKNALHPVVDSTDLPTKTEVKYAQQTAQLGFLLSKQLKTAEGSASVTPFVGYRLAYTAQQALNILRDDFLVFSMPKQHFVRNELMFGLNAKVPNLFLVKGLDLYVDYALSMDLTKKQSLLKAQISDGSQTVQLQFDNAFNLSHQLRAGTRYQYQQFTFGSYMMLNIARRYNFGVGLNASWNF